MQFSRQFRAWAKAVALLPGFAWLFMQAGCDSGGADLTKPVYTSAEQEDKQKQGIADAMKGGAYGKAGRKAAKQPGFSE